MMEQKTALITGASRGIGRATALKFAKEGYNLALCCQKNEALLMDTVTQCGLSTENCFMGVFDIKNHEHVLSFVQEALSKFGHIDVLVNNAGISHIGLLSDMSDSEWDSLLQTNLGSVFNVCKSVLPSMISRKAGRIINISSVWGNIGASCEVAYSATKGGLNSYTKALAKELAPSNICVNAAAFGFIDTEMNQTFSNEEKIRLYEEIPAGRAGTSVEAADLIFLLTLTPDYLTGQVITMDGGWT